MGWLSGAAVGDPARRLHRRAHAASARRGGRVTSAAFAFLAALLPLGALVGALVLRGRDAGGIELGVGPRHLADAKLWRLSPRERRSICTPSSRSSGLRSSSCIDEHGFSEQTAALVVRGRAGSWRWLADRAGRWSDLVGSSRRAAAAGRTRSRRQPCSSPPCWRAGRSGPWSPALVLAGGLSMAWNGLSFAAAAELAGPVTGAAPRSASSRPCSAAVGVVSSAVLFAASVTALSLAGGFRFLPPPFPLAGWSRCVRCATRALARYGKRVSSGSRSRRPPSLHSEVTRYSRLPAPRSAFSVSCCRMSCRAVSSDRPSCCPSSTPLWSA